MVEGRRQSFGGSPEADGIALVRRAFDAFEQRDLTASWS